ncbi:MAG: hypothetical protein HY904_01340 [Deltaproteobacteria bacterium]|nr:hypothetical protein [Deltaproteobacteria bacterium]
MPNFAGAVHNTTPAPVIPRAARSFRAAATLLLVLAPQLTTAQTLSPGRLGRSHEELEGVVNCTKCHEFGKKLDGDRCLECHDSLRKEIAAPRGMHARLVKDDRACLECHHDHRGVDASLTEWGGPREKWDHGKAGWPLDGKHAEARCKDCHEPRRVTESALKKRFAAGKPGTYLGLGRRCVDCHFDEHRGQFKVACDKCHGAKAFKPAPRFDHAASFRLRGAHATTACRGCHPRVEEPAGQAFPAPKDPRGYVRYHGAPKRCVDCHKDVHKGAYGNACSRCHNETDWHATRIASAEPHFHDKTNFPLLGKHRNVACDHCHPGKPGGGLQLTGFPYQECMNCHVDAHLGQLKPGPDRLVYCERCHDEEGFAPTTFPRAEHEYTRLPLDGAHRAVACDSCHAEDRARFAGVELPRRPAGRPERRTDAVSFVALVFPDKDPERCDSCHQDPHAGQFTRGGEPRRCEACHTADDWRQLQFDHARDTAFPLRGAHARGACTSCHVAPGAAQPVTWRGAPARCASCHDDVHRGQFNAAGGNPADCARCHDENAFKPATFVHAGVFDLKGRHASARCAACHPALPGSAAAWYRGVPRRCESCHADFHAAGAAAVPSASRGPCAGCHDETDWQRVTFDHDNTRMPLRDAHAGQPCRACHQDASRLAIDTACGSCHVDVHGGRLGTECLRCHDQRTFRSGAGVEAHAATRFPLYGRHAVTPCDRCHVNRADRTYGGVTPDCARCHADDAARTAGRGVDHAPLGPEPDCRRCHTTVTFTGGVLPEHDRCFNIYTGPHRGIACNRCHTSLAGLGVDNCTSFTAMCTHCHACEKMDRIHEPRHVVGYQCADRKCYECHGLRRR